MKNLIKLFGSLGIVMLVATGAYSQSDTAVLEHLSLKELLNVKITTASKTSQGSELASAVVKVITREQIRMRGYQSLLDVLYDMPGFKIDDKMYSGMRNSITVRGIQGSEKIQILLDGVSITSPSGEAMPVMQNYPVHLAEQIEVLYGPASALYGANAVSAIVNIITRKNENKDLLAEASATAGSYGYTNNTLYLSKTISEKTSLTVAGQYYYDRQPDYSKIYAGDPLFSLDSHKDGVFNTIYGPMAPKAPVKPRYEAPMEAYNVYGSLRSGDFSFNIFHTYFKTPSFWENNTSNALYNKEVNMAQTITMANGAYKKQMGRFLSTTSLTASKYDLLPSSNYRNLYTNMEPGYKYSTCDMIRADQQIDFDATDDLHLTAGATVEYYNAIPQSGDLSEPVSKQNGVEGVYLGTRAYYNPDGLAAKFYFIRYNNVGAYFQTQYRFAKNFNVTAGARYDDNSRYGSTFNPRVGFVLQPVKKTTVKLLYGAAYRAPSPSDSYAHYGAFETADSGRSYHSHFLHLANPGLKPVKSHTMEMNVIQQLSADLVMVADGYFTILKGLHTAADDNFTSNIYQNSYIGVPVDYVEVFVNRGKQVNYGGSLELNWKKWIGPVSLRSYASLSYVNGRIKGGLNEYNEFSKDIEIDFVSPWMGHVGTEMKWGRFTCSPRLLVMGRQRIFGTADTSGAVTRRQTIAGYELLNVSMRYQVNRNVSVYLNGTNVLDQRYTNVSFLMDNNKQDTELYRGQPQDPIRLMGGIVFSLR